MLLASVAIIIGLAILVWSADRFVEGAAATASHLGIPPLLIGMVVVGFGTSAPEMVVSAISASEGSPGLALGNAFGSNITNIALILGITAIISPVAVHSKVLRQELPMLCVATLVAAWVFLDGELSRVDAVVLLVLFLALMAWTIFQGLRHREDALDAEMASEIAAHPMPLSRSVVWLVIGILLLIISSRVLVWGAVEVAAYFGVSDLIIGLTVVAVGTSLPELAASVMSARRGEHDLALGNVIGSNLFNTLAVVGIAGVIFPAAIEPELISRDLPVVGALTFSLFVIGFGFTRGFRGAEGGRVNRIEAIILLVVYVAYNWVLISSVRG